MKIAEKLIKVLMIDRYFKSNQINLKDEQNKNETLNQHSNSN